VTRCAHPRRLIVGIAMALATVMGPMPVRAHDNPRVLPPQSHPLGATYGQWNARWWQWLYQTPVSINPEFSAAGAPDAPAAVDCSAGQRGDVWFIGGTFLPTSTTPQGVVKDDVYRTCSIPTGTFLFFPVLNDEFDNLGCPSTHFTARRLRSTANNLIDHIVPGSMSVTIDGASVSGVADSKSAYRSPSPWFSYTLPADNIGAIVGCNFPAGTTPPPPADHPHRPGATADGVYLMLAPLSPGIHTIHFGGEINVPSSPPPAPPLQPVDFIENINYTITVIPR
jgi:hypothetical protein